MKLINEDSFVICYVNIIFFTVILSIKLES